MKNESKAPNISRPGPIPRPLPEAGRGVRPIPRPLPEAGRGAVARALSCVLRPPSFVLLVLAVLAVAGCGGQNNGTSAGSTTGTAVTGHPKSAVKYTFALIPKSENNPVFSIAEKGAEQEAAALGDTKVIYKGTETGAPADEARIVSEMTSERVSGMAMSVIDPNAVRKPIDDAVAAGIPVMCFDSDAPDSKRFTFYSVSDEQVGKQLGNLLVMAVGGKQNMSGEVAIMSGQPSAPNLQGRVKGALSVLAQFPGIKVLPTVNCDDNIAKSVEEVRTTMAAHPNLRGWIMVGGWPLFAQKALDPIPNFNRTKVVSVDALDKEWPYLQNGQVYCLLGQKLFGWGQVSIKTLHDYVTGKNKNPPAFINSGYDLVFNNPTAADQALAKGNVKVWSLDDYKKQWAEWNKAS